MTACQFTKGVIGTPALYLLLNELLFMFICILCIFIPTTNEWSYKRFPEVSYYT